MPAKKRWRKLMRWQALTVIFGLIAVSVGFFAYLEAYDRSSKLSVHFVNPDGSKSSQFLLEVANTAALRKKGLMYRKEMKESEGMIFIYPEMANHSFWMKNTFIALDMIFVSPGLEVVGMLESVQPFDETSRSIGKPSRYVIELLAGTVKKENITEGSRLKLKSDIPKTY